MIKIDQNLCIGCGACEAICPDNFKIDESGKAQVVGEGEADCAKMAAESCPVQAIEVK
jgi:ferredoxin